MTGDGGIRHDINLMKIQNICNNYSSNQYHRKDNVVAIKTILNSTEKQTEKKYSEAI